MHTQPLASHSLILDANKIRLFLSQRGRGGKEKCLSVPLSEVEEEQRCKQKAVLVQACHRGER